MSITLLVRFIGKKGHGDSLSALLQPMPKDNDIPGCEGWEVFRNSMNPDDFLLLEHWRSISDHQAFIAEVKRSGGLREVEAHIESATRTYLEAASGDA